MDQMMERYYKRMFITKNLGSYYVFSKRCIQWLKKQKLNRSKLHTYFVVFAFNVLRNQMHSHSPRCHGAFIYNVWQTWNIKQKPVNPKQNFGYLPRNYNTKCVINFPHLVYNVTVIHVDRPDIWNVSLNVVLFIWFKMGTRLLIILLSHHTHVSGIFIAMVSRLARLIVNF